TLIAWARTADFLELTKPRITLMVLVTTLVGFYLGLRGSVPLVLLGHTLLGTALVASGASAFNMYLERHFDSLMKRTHNRPLPAGRLQAGEALAFAVTITVAGGIYLLAFVNVLTSLVAAITLLSYLFVYTPLKRRTWLCTLVGAVPGGLPAAMAWTAITGHLSLGAWIVFGIVFFWQLPHFYAIGWIYREDYARAGYPLLAVVDSSGSRTSRQSDVYIVLLILVTVMPVMAGLAGFVYLVGALALGIAFLACGVWFTRSRDRASARRLFMASILYLPILLALLMADKIAP
ncbi:MAG TPA: heme o synthase, partial [Acidobacteriota bacterium]|nr:heme o synthase [Acidobacteriota bacterium]